MSHCAPSFQGCKMSFYWQNAVPQEASQPSASTWDNINLGGATAPQQPHASFSYENQFAGNASGGGSYETYSNPYAAQWEQYHAQQAALQQQQQQQQYQQAQQVPQVEAVQQPTIQHQPILTREEVPSATPVVQSLSNVHIPVPEMKPAWSQESLASQSVHDEKAAAPSIDNSVQQPYSQQPAVEQYNQQFQQQEVAQYQQQNTWIDPSPEPVSYSQPPTEDVRAHSSSTVTVSSAETVVTSASQHMPSTEQVPLQQQEPVQVAPSAAFDMGGFGEEEETPKLFEDTPQVEQVEQSATVSGGWGEEWSNEEKKEEIGEREEDNHPRTSTPSHVEEHVAPLEPEASPIPNPQPPSTSVPPPSPLDSGSPSPSVPSSTVPPTVTCNTFAPPPPIVLAPSERAEHQMETQTSNSTKTPTPPASTDSWVEISSSNSEVVSSAKAAVSSIGGVPPLASSSPVKKERSSASSSTLVNGVCGRAEEGKGTNDSDSTHDSKKNVRERVKNLKLENREVLNRIGQYRSSGRESNNRTPTRLNPLLEAGRTRGVAATKSSTPKDYGSHDTSYPPPLRSDLSAIEGARMFGEHSLDYSIESHGYGEDIVESHRKDRHRNQRYRPGSRARSEYGEGAPPSSRGTANRSFAYEQPQHASHMHPHGYYPTGRMSLGRHSTMGVPYPPNSSYYGMPPYDGRSQSTYDAAAYARFERSGRTAAEYDAYEYLPSEEEESEDEEEGAVRNESDNEMRRIAHTAARSRSSMGVAPSYSRMGYGERRLGLKETHYLGFVKLEMGVVDHLLRTIPPSPQFWTILEPIQKVAYLYYTALHRKNFADVTVFQNRFNREFFRFKCDGYSETEALLKICHSIHESFKAKRVASSQRAYEASQRQLFSDDRDTPESRVGNWQYSNGPQVVRPRSQSQPRIELVPPSTSTEEGGEEKRIPSILRKIRGKLRRLSDRGSLYEHNHVSDQDDVSIDTTPKEPLLFRTPHAFVTFGPGGRIVQVDPERSVASVYYTDVHAVVKDKETQRAVTLATSFKGPLLPNQTPPHIVRAYIQRQMDRIKRSDLAQADPRNDDIIDTLLVWQLLEVVVQQHGKVMGPDIARLLKAAGQGGRRSEKGGVGALETSITVPAPDPKAFDRFTQFLLDGLIDEAIDFAMSEGLFMDAITLARRLAPHRVEEVETRHLSSRPPSHPLLTLFAVANNQAAPGLTGISKEDRGCWRLHAALLFANLPQSHAAIDNIRRLGEVLSKRECNSAADFCFLSVALLSNIDTFTPPVESTLPGVVPSGRKHIELIHASIPDDVAEATVCEYGFSLTDLHATEIFDYGSRLSGGATALAVSAPFHRRKMQYAQLLASWGGFSLDAFRYCTEVARAMWGTLYLFTAAELLSLAELADRLQKVSCADEASTMWIDSLSKLIPSLQTAQPQPAVDYSVQTVKQEETYPDYERKESISTEAAAWHSQQEPIEMHRTANENSGETQYRGQEDVHGEQSSQYTNNSRRGTITDASKASHSGCDQYSSGGTTTEGVTSEESTPRKENRRQRQTSILDDDVISPDSLSPPSPNPLAPSPAPLPTVIPQPTPTVPRPTPTPSLPTLPIVPTPAPLPQQPIQQQQTPKVQQHTGPRQQDQQGQEKTGLDGETRGKKDKGGLGGWLRGKMSTILPSSDEMKLPDDKKKTIYYDETKGRYVGEGVEEETAPPPPPAMASMPSLLSSDPSVPPMGSLRAARTSGGNRYFNPLNEASKGNGSATVSPPVAMPAPPTFPSQFGFIPTMPDDAVSDSPFSEGSGQPIAEGGEASEVVDAAK